MTDTVRERITPRSLAGLKIQKVTEIEPTFNMLVYGEPGVGKTRFAGSSDAVPSMRKVLFVDIEAGTMSLRDMFPEVDVVRIQSWKDMQELYDALFAGGHGYNTIVLDSLTEIQKFNMYNIMQQVVQENTKMDEDVPSMREWGRNLEQMRKFVRAFRDLPVNTIFTALARSDKDQRSGSILKKPSLSGKLADEVAGFLDIVSYMYTKEVDGEAQRLMLTGTTDTIVAKDRTDRLPIVLQNPTMEIVHSFMTGKMKSDGSDNINTEAQTVDSKK